MQTTFRFPGSSDYAYVEFSTTEGSPQDNARELRDIDEAFLSLVGNLLSTGCALVAMGPLKPQVIEQPAQNAAGAPQWLAQPPQEAQGYSPTPPAYQAPQYASQAPQQAYQPQQAQQYAAPTPPGQQAPICQQHGQPAVFKPGGISRTSQRPYDAFWACNANDRNCTKASNFPKP